MFIFIHIPKTAGSSVNKMLERSMGYGISHVESRIDKEDFGKSIIDCNWISGHVTRATFEINLSGIEDKKYFTFLRSPMEQIISHLKWQFAILDKGRTFFLSHPIKNQMIALEAMNVNYDSPSEVIDFLDRYRGLFLNFQTRYILSDPTRKVDASVVRDECSFFSLIGTTSNLYKLLSGFLDIEMIESRENENNISYFNEEIFHEGEVASFIKEHNARDTFIYNIVKNEIEPRLLDLFS